MSRKVLQFLMFGLGIAAVAIGSGIFAFGPEPVSRFFADPVPGLLPSLFADTPDSWSRDADNEMRFYSVFWFAYGTCLIAAARHLSEWAKQIPILLVLFFAGGVGRTISILQTGWPHPMFVLLMAIELIMPFIMYALYWVADFAESRANT